MSEAFISSPVDNPQNMFETHTANRAQDVSEYFAYRADELKDPSVRREHFLQMSGEDFIDEVQRLRSLIETGNSLVQHAFDGHNVHTGILDPPDRADKEALLSTSWDTVKKILGDYDISDDQALERAGVVVGTMLVLIHPFGDGNGRTARILSLMIERGVADDDDVRRLLHHDGASAWKLGFCYEARVSGSTGTGEWLLDEQFNKQGREAYVDRYITDEERSDSYRHKTRRGTDEATSLDEARYWKNAWRKRRAGEYLAVLDLIDDNPTLPISSDLKRLKRLRDKTDREIAQLELDDAKESDEFTRGLLHEKRALYTARARRYEIAESFLGVGFEGDEQEASFLDQIVALHRLGG